MKGATVKRAQPAARPASAGRILAGILGEDDSGTMSGVLTGGYAGYKQSVSAAPFPAGMMGVIGQSKVHAEMQSAVRMVGKKEQTVDASSNGCLKLVSQQGQQAEDYIPIKKLGQGASGVVYLVKLKDDSSNKMYVLKQIEIGKARAYSAPSSERFSAMARMERDNVMREVKLMASIDSPHIIRYITSFLTASSVAASCMHIVMDYAEGGSVAELIRKTKGETKVMDEQLVWKCLLQVASGLRAIHDARVIHRDVKPANLLLSNGDFKIADLGIAVNTGMTNVQGKMRTGRCGTPCYMAPEVSNDLPYDGRADVWSLGCVMYEMCSYRIAFPEGTCVDVGTRAESGVSMYEIEKAAQQLQLPRCFSDALNDHVMWCLNVDASKRPLCADLLTTRECTQRSLSISLLSPPNSSTCARKVFERPTSAVKRAVRARPVSAPVMRKDATSAGNARTPPARTRAGSARADERERSVIAGSVSHGGAHVDAAYACIGDGDEERFGPCNDVSLVLENSTDAWDHGHERDAPTYDFGHERDAPTYDFVKLAGDEITVDSPPILDCNAFSPSLPNTHFLSSSSSSASSSPSSSPASSPMKNHHASSTKSHTATSSNNSSSGGVPLQYGRQSTTNKATLVSSPTTSPTWKASQALHTSPGARQMNTVGSSDGVLGSSSDGVLGSSSDGVLGSSSDGVLASSSIRTATYVSSGNHILSPQRSVAASIAAGSLKAHMNPATIKVDVSPLVKVDVVKNQAKSVADKNEAESRMKVQVVDNQQAEFAQAQVHAHHQGVKDVSSTRQASAHDRHAGILRQAPVHHIELHVHMDDDVSNKASASRDSGVRHYEEHNSGAEYQPRQQGRSSARPSSAMQYATGGRPPTASAGVRRNRPASASAARSSSSNGSTVSSSGHAYMMRTDQFNPMMMITGYPHNAASDAHTAGAHAQHMRARGAVRVRPQSAHVRGTSGSALPSSESPAAMHMYHQRQSAAQHVQVDEYEDVHVDDDDDDDDDEGMRVQHSTVVQVLGGMPNGAPSLLAASSLALASREVSKRTRPASAQVKRATTTTLTEHAKPQRPASATIVRNRPTSARQSAAIKIVNLQLNADSEDDEELPDYDDDESDDGESHFMRPHAEAYQDEAVDDAVVVVAYDDQAKENKSDQEVQQHDNDSSHDNGRPAQGDSKSRIKKVRETARTRSSRLVQAGADRRLKLALQHVLAPTLEGRPGVPLTGLPHLLHAQLGVPFKAMALKDSNGQKVSLKQFLVSQPQLFFIGQNDTVTLREGSIRPGESVSGASKRILSQILRHNK